MFHSFIIPEVIYIPLLLGCWIAAMFSGIAFVYGIYIKNTKKNILFWAGIFALCLLLVFLLMNGFVTAGGRMD